MFNEKKIKIDEFNGFCGFWYLYADICKGVNENRKLK